MLESVLGVGKTVHRDCHGGIDRRVRVAEDDEEVTLRVRPKGGIVVVVTGSGDVPVLHHRVRVRVHLNKAEAGAKHRVAGWSTSIIEGDPHRPVGPASVENAIITRIDLCGRIQLGSGRRGVQGRNGQYALAYLDVRRNPGDRVEVQPGARGKRADDVFGLG